MKRSPAATSAFVLAMQFAAFLVQSGFYISLSQHFGERNTTHNQLLLINGTTPLVVSILLSMAGKDPSCFPSELIGLSFFVVLMTLFAAIALLLLRYKGIKASVFFLSACNCLMAMFFLLPLGGKPY
jgi:hypothetical protein